MGESQLCYINKATAIRSWQIADRENKITPRNGLGTTILRSKGRHGPNQVTLPKDTVYFAFPVLALSPLLGAVEYGDHR